MEKLSKILDIWSYLSQGFTVLYVLVVILVVVLIILENRSPLKSIAWILVLVLIPVGGFILYLIFGQNYRKQKMFSRKGLGDLKWLQLMSEDQKNLLTKQDLIDEYGIEKYKHIMTLLLNNSKALVARYNNVDILNDGEQTFNSIFEEIEKAKHSINLQSYIIEEGRIVDRLFELLVAKAKEGVEVRIIYDGVGSIGLRRKTIKRLRTAGIKIYPFLPVSFPYFTHKSNYRNHRKIVVIDGKVGFVGGLNFADRYVDGLKGIGCWRDTHLKIEGEATRHLQLVFLIDWYFVSQEVLIDKTRYMPEFKVENECLVQLAVSGADSDWASILQAYFVAITSAKKYVYLSTPYFMPGPSMMMAIKTASMRGVDVRILVPYKSDSFFSYWCTNSYIQELLDVNVKVYRYKKGFNHSKIMMIDDTVSSVGTANLDTRSFEQNFEVNALLYNENLCKELVLSFKNDLEDSKLIIPKEWALRPRKVKILESFIRLFSPLL
jgi:cardiolipin synthase